MQNGPNDMEPIWNLDFNHEQVVSIKEGQFFFDYIRQLSDLLKRSQSGHIDYQVFFMRKLWVNFLPGRDPIADNIFNFAQEVPKYLRGYYDIPNNLIGKLGALIFLANYGENKDLMKKISKDNIDKLMPQGHKVNFSYAEFQQIIMVSVLKNFR